MELLINEKAHRRLYREAGGNYGGIARRLVIQDHKLAVAGLDKEPEIDADAMVQPQPQQATRNRPPHAW